MELKEFFARTPRFAIAFSGGVDSSYLMHAAKNYGCDVKAYFIQTAFQPQFELDDAKKMAYFLSVPMTIGSADIFTDPNIAGNPADRCYYCKTTVAGPQGWVRRRVRRHERFRRRDGTRGHARARRARHHLPPAPVRPVQS